MSGVSDEMNGMGKILKGRDEIAKVRYKVRIHDKLKTVLISRTPKNEIMAHLSRIECKLTAVPPIPVSVLQILTLVMSDGKKLDFRMLKSGARVTTEVY